VITELATGELSGDALRVHRAGEHCRRLGEGVLSAHAVAMARNGCGVVLLGGHGAGKSVTGLALAARGWEALAGDVTLVRIDDSSGRASLTGGTRRFLLRPTFTSAHDAYRAPTSGDAVDPTTRVDLTDRLRWVALGGDEIELRLAVNIAADSGAGSPAVLARLDSHTSQSIWWRASGYLVDRVLDDPSAVPLRCMEQPALAAARMRLARTAAQLVPVREGFGTAEAVAAAIEGETTKEHV